MLVIAEVTQITVTEIVVCQIRKWHLKGYKATKTINTGKDKESPIRWQGMSCIYTYPWEKSRVFYKQN